MGNVACLPSESWIIANLSDFAELGIFCVSSTFRSVLGSTNRTGLNGA